jgi:hypothetical protein
LSAGEVVGELNLPEVAPLQRRRMSRLTKMALRVAIDAAQVRPDRLDYVVFASQHGELNTTLGLLAQLAAGETLSPTSFAQSVHNTAGGTWALICGEHVNVTSIAAGVMTFPMALLDAAVFLRLYPAARVLVVYCDERLPDLYSDGCGGGMDCDFAASLLIQGASVPEAARVSLSAQFEGGASAVPVVIDSASTMARAFMETLEQVAALPASGIDVSMAGWRWNARHVA